MNPAHTDDEGFIGAPADPILQHNQTVIRVLAWQIERTMAALTLNKKQIAKRIGISESCLEQLLDQRGEHIPLRALQNAAAAVGQQLRLELV